MVLKCLLKVARFDTSLKPPPENALHFLSPLGEIEKKIKKNILFVLFVSFYLVNLSVISFLLLLLHHRKVLAPSVGTTDNTIFLLYYLEMEKIFKDLAEFCRNCSAVYNVAYNGIDTYDFVIRFPNQRLVTCEDFIELGQMFSSYNDEWYCLVSFDKDCIRLTYSKNHL